MGCKIKENSNEKTFDDFFSFDDFFKRDPKEIKRESYAKYKKTPESMSYWLNAITNSTTAKETSLKTPETKIIQLDFEHWDKLTEDGVNLDSNQMLNDCLKSNLGDFQAEKEIFLKTGIFSNKFEFSGTICSPDRNDLGEKLKSMYYVSMMVGAHMTTEAVFRELIHSKENVPTIYDGMPLHTEFRVFYDFDNHRTVGVSNYWHPNIMTKRNLREDYETYKTVRDKIVSEYENEKDFVVEEVEKLAKGVQGLTGRWSIDVMKNGGDYWFIDMARMDYSALREVMDEI